MIPRRAQIIRVVDSRRTRVRDRGDIRGPSCAPPDLPAGVEAAILLRGTLKRVVKEPRRPCAMISRKRVTPFERISESGSSPRGSEATRTSRPHSRRAGSERPIAFWPAWSESKQRMTDSTNRRSRRACSEVNAVPCGAMTFLDAGFESADHINLTFADDGGARLDKRALGFVESIEHAPLGEEGRVG